jgi:hypothetical protein
MDTERLIRTLAENVEPVRPLAPPWRRTMFWAAAGVVYLIVLATVMSVRDDLVARMQEPRFLIEQAAALVTGLTAAVAAFATIVPGDRRQVVWVPLASAAVWVAIVSAGALRELRVAEPGDVLFQADWRCVWAILAAAAVPATTMAMMLRRGVPLTPRVTAALGGLAAAGLGNLGVCLFDPHSSNLVVLIWHCGTVLVMAALAGLAGRQLLRWPAAGTLSVPA